MPCRWLGGFGQVPRLSGTKYRAAEAGLRGTVRRILSRHRNLDEAPGKGVSMHCRLLTVAGLRAGSRLSGSRVDSRLACRRAHKEKKPSVRLHC